MNRPGMMRCGMEQTAVVIEVRGGEAVVRARRASACGGCAGQSACGTLGSWSNRVAEMRVANPVDARVGDVVSVQVPQGALLRAAARLYGVPMLGFFTAGFLARGLALAWGMASPDAWAALGALAGTGATLLLMRSRGGRGLDGARIARVLTRAADAPGAARDASPAGVA